MGGVFRTIMRPFRRTTTEFPSISQFPPPYGPDMFEPGYPYPPYGTGFGPGRYSGFNPYGAYGYGPDYGLTDPIGSMYGPGYGPLGPGKFY